MALQPIVWYPCDALSPSTSRITQPQRTILPVLKTAYTPQHIASSRHSRDASAVIILQPNKYSLATWVALFCVSGGGARLRLLRRRPVASHRAAGSAALAGGGCAGGTSLMAQAVTRLLRAKAVRDDWLLACLCGLFPQWYGEGDIHRCRKRWERFEARFGEDVVKKGRYPRHKRRVERAGACVPESNGLQDLRGW
jgi:hypothetical protein